jgi:hypothetical protein
MSINKCPDCITPPGTRCESAPGNCPYRADQKRLDWLADPANQHGQVLLPSDCVRDNPGDMRAAIDAAMALGE